MTIIANLIVCALVLMALAAFWILVSVWLDRDKIQDHRGTLVRGDDPRADKSVDPVVKHRDYEMYPLTEEESDKWISEQQDADYQRTLADEEDRKH